MKNIATLFFLLIHYFGFCQFNSIELDYSDTGINSLSVFKDSNLILIGEKKSVGLIVGNDTIKLRGSYGYFDPVNQKIITFLQTAEHTSRLFVYGKTGNVRDSFVVAGVITGVSSFNNQDILISIIANDAKGNIGILLQMNITNGQQKKLFKPNIAELTSVHLLSNGNIALTGTQKNYIISAEGSIIKEITAPHRSFGKTSIDKKLFLILQEYSDGSYIDVYNEDGSFVEKIEYEHQKKTKSGTRRCGDCISKTAAFVDFDLSPDKTFLVAKDQYGEVYILNQQRKLLSVYKDSKQWSFLTFIDNNTFMYINILDKTLHYITIN
jgi:hypothetical protein